MKASQLAKIEAIKILVASTQLPYLTVSDKFSMELRRDGADMLRAQARAMQSLAEKFEEEERAEASK